MSEMGEQHSQTVEKVSERKVAGKEDFNNLFTYINVLTIKFVLIGFEENDYIHLFRKER